MLNSVEVYLRAGSVLAYVAVFVGGILASLTPCLYPVIPVTVGFIGGRSRGSRLKGFLLSLSYVVGMAVTYAALGSAAVLAGRVFGEVGASPIPYLVVGNLCLVFSLSLLDVLAIPLPSFSPGRLSGRRPAGIVGAFLVGMASGLIVGPCTAPILGSLLVYVGSRQNLLFGVSLLFVFALGMGSPLVVLGTFSGMIANLPKSGRWLENVKKGFGLLMLLAAEYLFLQAGKRLL